jgi:hypothetical protein
MSIEDFELILSLVARRFSGRDEARLEQRVKSDLGIDGAAADLFHGEVERIFDLDPGQRRPKRHGTRPSARLPDS